MKTYPSRFGKTVIGSGLALLCLQPFNSQVFAQAPTVTYTVSGTAGDYTLDFTVQNNLSTANYPGGYIYAFGVNPENSDSITASPGAFTDANPYNTDTSTPVVGPNIQYDDNWSGGDIPDGQALSGFDVSYGGTTAPTSVEWFSFADVPGGNYPTGGDNLDGSHTTPLFDGTATEASVPDGGSCLAMLAAGVAALGALKRKLS